MGCVYSARVLEIKHALLCYDVLGPRDVAVIASYQSVIAENKLGFILVAREKSSEVFSRNAAQSDAEQSALRFIVRVHRDESPGRHLGLY